MSPPPHATREAVVEALYRDVDGLSPRLKDRRLIRRFAATRDHDRSRTRRLLVEYSLFYAKSGLLDDHLGRDPGVRTEMRRRGTMRLLDPRDAPGVHDDSMAIEDADTEAGPQRTQRQRLTFLQLHTPSMWRTVRDKDGCPTVYTNLESYRRGANKDVENTFVWILETVCREMDVSGDETDASDGAGEGGGFTILLDASTCSTHTRDFKAAAWIACCANLGRVLQTALKRGFRGRLHRFYVYPTGQAARSLLR